MVMYIPFKKVTVKFSCPMFFILPPEVSCCINGLSALTAVGYEPLQRSHTHRTVENILNIFLSTAMR